VALFDVLKTEKLDFFMAFSSMTALIPRLARGASDYAMANGFVDFFMAYQRRKTGHAGIQSIIWSDWHETGAMTRQSEAAAADIRTRFDRLGIRTFSNPEGCALFELAVTSQIVGAVGYVDPQRFEQVRPKLLHAAFSDEPVPVTAAEPILRHLERWEAQKRSGTGVSVEDVMAVIDLDDMRRLDPLLIHRIHTLLLGETADTVDYAQVIASTVKDVLKLKSIGSAQPFQNCGLDSISAAVLATRLEKTLKREMRPQWFIEFPTVESLTHHLTAELAV
jgi:acyl carrier protein